MSLSSLVLVFAGLRQAAALAHLAAAGGACSGAACSTSEHCRSKWGYCGVTAQHCNAESTWTAACGDQQATTTSASLRGASTTAATVPAAATACAGAPCSTSAHCRSEWGYCGVTAQHCNAESTWTAACDDQQATTASTTPHGAPATTAALTTVTPAPVDVTTTATTAAMDGDALPLAAWSPAVSAEGAAATLNTHNGGYDLPGVDVCFHDKYSDIVSRDAANWISIDEWKAFGLSRSVTTTIPASVSTTGTSVSARDVNVAQLTVTEGGVEKTIDAAIGFGHGVANLKCGDCYIVKTSGTNLPEGSWIHNDANFDELIAYDRQTRYSVIRTVDIATWSLEISDPALYYLLPLDGRIDHSTQPVYQPVDCKAVISSAQR